MGLQLSHHETFQHHLWRVQRAGWLLIVLLLLATVAGLLGPGPLSSATATGADGQMRVYYDRFAHVATDDQITVTVAAHAVRGRTVDLAVAAEWVKSVTVTGITPRPQAQTTTGYGLRLTFATEPGAGLRAEIGYRATTFGRIDAGVRFDGATVDFRQFVYP